MLMIFSPKYPKPLAHSMESIEILLKEIEIRENLQKNSEKSC